MGIIYSSPGADTARCDDIPHLCPEGEGKRQSTRGNRTTATVRTDATRFCPHCVVRFGRSQRCPRCDHPAFELDTRARRRDALKALARGSLGREVSRKVDRELHPLRLVSLWLNWGFLPVCALGFLLGLLEVHTLRSGVGGAGMAALAQIGLMLTLLALYFSSVWVRSWGPWARGLAGARTAGLRERMQLVAPTEEQGPSLVLEGVVRAEATLSSPLAHQACVAYRLVGHGPVGVVNDAAGSSFMLETDDGVTTRVEASRCTLDVPVVDSPRVLRPDRALTRFLERRGVFPERGPLQLAEALLRDGDRVTVEGAATEAEQANGYRDRRALRVLRETSETPLRIRRADKN
ncbi:MAG: hypothetical protein GXP55_11690 [Deltaproteobacteria bacterium]|nr:hypothetical protein [Deltaproteobacteria bacterium]